MVTTSNIPILHFFSVVKPSSFMLYLASSLFFSRFNNRQSGTVYRSFLFAAVICVHCFVTSLLNVLLWIDMAEIAGSRDSEMIMG